MRVYEFLARRNFPRTYTGKILLVSFLGVHVPMIGAVSYVLLGDPTPFMEQIDVLVAMLIATLVGTAATMFIMVALLSPITAATRAADGYLRDRRLPTLPTRYTDGAGTLMASVQECITRLDGSIETVELRRRQLESDHAAKFRMLAGMRHDFRTPLTHILGFAQIMRAEAIGPIGTEAYRDYIASIGNSGQALLATLNSVLDLSDAEVRGQMDEDSEDVDLVALAREAIALEHLHAETRGVTVAFDAPAELHAHTVRDVVKNLFTTMLQAAIASTPAGGRVGLRLGEDMSVDVASPGALSLEDVPPHLRHHVQGDLSSSTGSNSRMPETSTPTTLRLSLIHTLCTAAGARIDLIEAQGEGHRIRIDTRQEQPAAMAAE